jgi:hypothetical protein
MTFFFILSIGRGVKLYSTDYRIILYIYLLRKVKNTTIDSVADTKVLVEEIVV